MTRTDKGACGAIPFLESIGFTFELDWDGELTMSYPENMDGLTVANALAEQGTHITKNLKGWAALDRRQLLGGPFNGRAHGHREGTRIPMPVRRGRWAVYVVAADGRAWFRGYATSEAKARWLDLLPTTKERR